MTDRPRPYHRAEAERLLDYADEWTAQAGELSPEASELSCLAYAAVHALLAIVDALTKPCDCAKHDAYAAREAEQREAGGRSIRDLVARSSLGTPEVEAARAGVDPEAVKRVLARVAELAESDPPEATGDDLTASEGESESVEGEGADDAPEALLCPECGHDLEDHCEYCCGCPRSPSGVAYTLLADAVKAEREAGTDG